MFLFLVAGIPAFSWLVSVWYFKGMLNPKDFLISAGYGVVTAVPAMFLHGLITPIPSSPLEPLALYVVGCLAEFILPAALAVVSLTLTARLRRQSVSQDYHARSFPFMTGFFSYVAAAGWFFGNGARDACNLLGLPLLWMQLILVLVHLGEPLFSGSRAGLVFTTLRLVCFCLLFGLVSLLFRENFDLLAWILAAFLIGFTLYGCRNGFPSPRDLVNLLRF
jgi:hypothetical protein